MKRKEFEELRYGMFVHYGLYSLLERGEWVMNREKLSREQMLDLAARFTAENFDADALCALAVRGGMRYIVLTTMHHDGFCLYDTQLTDFNSVKSPCGRDLVAETIAAARKHGLKVGLYHSLNNWSAVPDAVDALEDKTAYGQFIANTFERVEELVRNYDFDILWYDGWWPFDAAGWKADEMNARLLSIKPGLLFNPRNGAEGDFATPEGHMSAPSPWRPWEGCMTLNDNWGYHAGDDNWKRPRDVLKLLLAAAKGRGNLLLNVGPRGDGSIPEESVTVIERVGRWLKPYGEAVYPAQRFSHALIERGDHRGDWCHHGPLTAAGNNLYLVATSWPGTEFTLTGLGMNVLDADLLGSDIKLTIAPENGKVKVSGLPEHPIDEVASVIRMVCDAPPTMYICGGMRTPAVPHCWYDPMKSDCVI
jgi:alpha-L-fucosidase